MTAEAAPAPVNVLFTPVRIGGVEIPNRLMMPPMTTRLSDDEGHVTDAVLAYYEARAAGGTGLITVEMASPEVAGRHRFRELGICDDKFVPGLRRLVEVIHSRGSKASIQLGHGGSRARRAVHGVAPVAPSAVPTPVFEIEHEIAVPEAMSVDRIRETQQAYVDAARRAQEAGFDMIEIHGAHGYLLSQFLSPDENRRTDEYGGSLENRARFGLEILDRIKADVPGLPVIFRIGVEDFFDGGISAPDGIEVARWAAERGADAVSVTAGHYRSVPSAERMIPPMAYPERTFLEYAAAVKRIVAVPVIGVGRFGDPALAEDALASGSLDLIAMGRQLLADPDWVAKTRTGVPVRRCLSCNHCVNDMRSGNSISCVVNPVAGRELDFQSATVRPGERIAVIGAGPAGLTYAFHAADGNQVTVIERADRPGGSFRYTGKAPIFNDVRAVPLPFDNFIANMEEACRTKGVTFNYGTDAADATDLLVGCDRVVIASGARYRWGLRPLVLRALDSGVAGGRAGSWLFAKPKMRDFLYYRLRRGDGERLSRQLGLGAQAVVVIGDADRAGKAREAIRSGYEAAVALGPTGRTIPAGFGTAATTK